MSTFKKMLLFSPEELELMKARQLKEYDPSLVAMARLQAQLETVLNDKELPKLKPDERLKLLQLIQHRFEQIKHETDVPIPLAGVSTGLPEGATEPEVTTSTEIAEPEVAAPAIKLFGVQKRYRKHVEHLMDIFSKHPDILSVNERNELVVHGTPIPHSNIQDLISDMLTTSKSRIAGPRPEGFAAFADALTEVNAPRSLFINPAINKAQQSNVEMGHPPPRKRPRIPLKAKLPKKQSHPRHKLLTLYEM